MTQPTQKPVATIRRGFIEAAIWSRVNKDHVTLYSVTFSRSYRDDKGEYQRTTSFNPDDCLVLAQIAPMAWNKVHQLRQAAYEQARAVRESTAPAPSGSKPAAANEPDWTSEVPF